jgi:hypothetical protein
MMNDMGTKWRQRQLCYLEKLFSEWDPDNGDAPYTSDHEIAKGHPPSIDEEPYDIHNK